MARIHVIVGVLLAAVLPAYSWLDGSGWLAWTMFSRSETYRLRAEVTDGTGVAHAINPTALATFADPETAAYLSGTEHWRHAPVGNAIRANLASLAKIACRCVPAALEATLTMDMRKTTQQPPTSSVAHVRCP
jgi:hypothetical protein